MTIEAMSAVLIVFAAIFMNEFSMLVLCPEYAAMALAFACVF
jgi:hypothetical protein